MRYTRKAVSKLRSGYVMSVNSFLRDSLDSPTAFPPGPSVQRLWLRSELSFLFSETEQREFSCWQNCQWLWMRWRLVSGTEDGLQGAVMIHGGQLFVMPIGNL